MHFKSKDKCVFLDRDGVLNEERGTYTYKLEDFKIIPGVKSALEDLKNAGFFLVVITNQAGITRGLFTKQDMQACHNFLQNETGNHIDSFYYAPNYPDYSNSLLRKPDSLMFEKAIAKHNIAVEYSYMIGNSERDMTPALKLGIQTMYIGETLKQLPIDYYVSNLREAATIILQNDSR